MAKQKRGNGKSAGTTPVTSIRHQDKRANIPTEELRDFVAADERAPKTMLYPRDPSLDPQLVWKGKDEQDAADLAVPIVPIYIQEKIHPQALIEDLRRQAAATTSVRPRDEQLSLFGDFNGLDDDFDKKVDFYRWEQHWTNRMILGDSLLVMTSLAEKEGLKGKVQTIYFDPPYGIKFGSNWQVSTRKRDVKDGKVEDLTRQPEQIRAFRDCWRIGVHSYLAYIRDILTAARELLTETGSIFVQIGDENVHLVRSVLDEVFGADNFVCQIAFEKTTSTSTDLLANVCDYLLWFGKDRERVKYRPLFTEKRLGEDGTTQYIWAESLDGKTDRRLTSNELADPSSLSADWRVFACDNLTSQRPRQGTDVASFRFQGNDFHPGKGTFKTDEDGLQALARANRLRAIGNSLMYKRILHDFPVSPIANTWADTKMTGFSEDKVYVVQTGIKVILRCLLMTTDPGDLVLDPTCGSGTTAFVAEQWGRRWITIDTSRVALALARTRLMAARLPYYYLAADFPQMAQMNTDEEIKACLRQSVKSVSSVDSSPSDVRKGFVYKRVPHVTLKSIANNPDIKEGMTRAQIDAAIARHAETETLYDQPYEDNKRIRVSGPFTVESLSPHRVIAADEDLDGTVSEQEGRKQQDFATMILDNLRVAGVQNTRKAERLKFDSLDPHAGRWIHALGIYHEADGKPRRAAISIGPEHGTVSKDWIKDAAKEAVQGVGFDLLIVCGFAFEAGVSEETKRYGSLVVLPCRMNPDLSMGEALLKKTGAGNLFMVFGEPDIEIRRTGSIPEEPATTKGKKSSKSASKDVSTNIMDQLIVELKGLDVYDPTTGEIRESSTDDIACWFIDTDYNGESFFVRHAYFTGAAKDGDGPYDKLKRALRAEIDESAWSSLYSITSRPFDAPASGKIAVKVINHYGDEVLKVFEV